MHNFSYVSGFLGIVTGALNLITVRVGGTSRGT
jgi:hypothetical protein